MKVTLTASERLNLSAVIPAQVGSIDEMIAAAGLRKQVALIPGEQEEIEYVVSDNGAPMWDNKKAESLVTDFTFTDEQVSVVKKGFELLAAEGRLPTSEFVLNLYQKFND